MNLVVYTAITGRFPDRLYEPHPGTGRDNSASKNAEFVCISDGSVRQVPPPWKLMTPIWAHEDPRRTARYHKILAHVVFPSTDYSIWMDASQKLLADPWWLVRKYLNTADIATYKHPERHDVWAEAQQCASWGKDEQTVMSEQVARYRIAGLPQAAGLMETTLLLRRHVRPVARLCDAWWREMVRGSVRDQLSLPYVLWQSRLPWTQVAGCRDKPVHCEFMRHVGRRAVSR